MVVYADRAGLPQLARPRRQSTRHDHRQRLTTEQRLTRALLALSAAAIPLTVLSPHDDPTGALGGARLREVAIAVPIAVFAGLLINVVFAAMRPYIGHALYDIADSMESWTVIVGAACQLVVFPAIFASMPKRRRSPIFPPSRRCWRLK